jgi:hypothetical protein
MNRASLSMTLANHMSRNGCRGGIHVLDASDDVARREQLCGNGDASTHLCSGCLTFSTTSCVASATRVRSLCAGCRKDENQLPSPATRERVRVRARATRRSVANSPASHFFGPDVHGFDEPLPTAIRLSSYIIVPEPNHLDAQLRQSWRSRFVSRRACHSVVRPAIELDAKTQFTAVEVQNESTFRMLPSELVATEITVPEPLPNRTLGGCRSLAKGSCESHSLHVPRLPRHPRRLPVGEVVSIAPTLTLTLSRAAGEGNCFSLRRTT